MNIRKAKRVYESVKIPPKLDDFIMETVEKQEKRKTKLIKTRGILAFTCSFCIVFIVLVNSNPSFAEATYHIPVIGKIAKIVTVKEYKEENEQEKIKVKMPALQNTGNTDIEKKINSEIQEKIDILVEEAKQRVEELWEMTQEFDGEIAVSFPMEAEIDYKIYYSNEDMVSFVIKKVESFYNAMEENYYYNINLKTGEIITLEDMLGSDYIEIANKQIKQKIEEIESQDENAMFFDSMDDVFLEHGSSFATVDTETDFYINEQKHVVIVFPKYSIAPGYMGKLEFEIK